MGAFRDIGHGHVWARPDGLKARCGGPELCGECAADQRRLKDVTKVFTEPIDIAILLRTKDRWQGEAHDLRKRLTELETMVRKLRDDLDAELGHHRVDVNWPQLRELGN